MSCAKHIVVGARASSLSKVQVEEVLHEIRIYDPHIVFECIFVKTTGDLDRVTSLRTLDKTDFFTREIDQMLLNKECRIAIHSAKDLPKPLANGLVLAALTKGVDSSDSLVLPEGVSLADLPPHSLIATSSAKREDNVRTLNKNLDFVDVRGTIEERLEKVQTGEVSGVVIAEAALIRLKLTHLNRIKLSGETTPLQGRLAILCREEDVEMRTLFGNLNR